MLGFSTIVFFISHSMTNLITTAKGKLDDPIMQEWAIHFYSDLPNNAHLEKTQIETDWFHELFITQLINSQDTSLLGQFFRKLPVQNYSKLTHLIVNNWTDWPSSLVASAAEILTVNAPDDLIQLFKNDLALLKTGNIDPFQFLSIDQLATENTSSTVAEFINEFSLVVLDLNNDFAQSFLFNPLFKLSKALSTETLKKLIAKVLDMEIPEKRRQSHFQSLFTGLFGSSEYLEMVFDRESFESPLKLSTLAPFFVDSASLEQLDSWLAELPKADEIDSLLETISSESDACHKLFELLKGTKQLSEKLQSQLALAACIHGLSKNTINTAHFDVTKTVDLLAIDINKSKWTELLIDHLKTLEPSTVSSLLIRHLQDDAAYFGAVYVANAMGELRYPEFINPLINAIGRGAGDFLCEAAQESLLKIGSDAQISLIAQWDSLDSSQKIFGQNLIKNIHGKTASNFIASRFSELMSFDLELACELIVASPDLRLLELLKPELRRKQSLIDRAFYILARLLDYEGPEVDAAKERAFAEHIRSKQAMEEMDSGFIPQNNSLYLELRCPSCDAVNQYKTKGVIISTEANIPFLLADEFPCASCNNYVDFTFTAMASMSVSAELIVSSTGKNGDSPQTAKVRTLDCRLEGKIIPLAVAISSLQKDLSAHPKKALKWFQLGNLITKINRPKATIDAYQKAVDYAPTAADAKFALAITLADNNQEGKAFSVLQFTLNQLPKWTFLSDFPDFGRTFANLYNHLRQRLGKTDVPAVHPSALSRSKKLGRNDPCSCGSGKKYKKCCGR
jgi:tetratricopeptide (TPR) repeat protein